MCKLFEGHKMLMGFFQFLDALLSMGLCSLKRNNRVGVLLFLLFFIPQASLHPNLSFVKQSFHHTLPAANFQI